MKTNHLIYWIRIALLCLAIALILSLITIPLLAKGIARMSGNTPEPDKLDIRPIPAPRPPLPSANNELPISATPAPPLEASGSPLAIPVPTPPTQVALPDSVPAQNSASGAPQRTIPVVISQAAIASSVIFILLLILMRRRRTSDIRSLHPECAS